MGEGGILSDAAYTLLYPQQEKGALLHITISIHSLEFSLGMSTAARLSRSLFARPSLQVSIFQVPVLKGKALFFSLAPFLIVKVDVSALKERKIESGK